MPAPTLTNVARPRAFGYGLALDERLFRLAVGPGRELTIRTAPLEAPRVNTTSSPEEAASEFGLTFARSQFDGGEGLFRAHLEGSAPDRFWDSMNVSVRPAAPGEFPSVRLLHTTESIEPSTDTELHMAYEPAAGALYMCDGTVLRKSTNPTAATPTWADDDPHDGETATDVEDVAALGDEVYAALGTNGIHRYTASAWSHWSNLTPAKRVWSVKGRIVASDGESLYELDPSGGAAPTALITLSPGLEWTDVCDGGSSILASATNGYVYAFSTDSGTMALTAQTLFEGEVPRALGQTQGVVAIGTESGTLGRWYVGVVDSNGQLVEIQLVKEWEGQSPRTCIGTRSTLITAVPDGTDTFLWRYDVTTGGVSRDLTVTGTSGNVWGLLVIGGTKFAAVDSAGLYRETDEYASEGYLIGPLGDFYSSADKSWIGARLETGDLVDGMTAELYYTTEPDAMDDPDSSSWIRVVRRNSGTGDPGEQALSSVVARSLAGMVKLTPSSDGLSTPAVRSFSFRAYPSSGNEDVIITAPVNVSDQIERRGRARMRVKGRGATEYATLRGFEGRPVLLQLFSPEMTVRGLVEEVALPVQAQTWRGSPTMVAQVTVRGRVSGAGVTSGSGTFGTYHLFGTTPTFGEVA